MRAHETAQGVLDLLDVHDENVSLEIAQIAEMLAKHVLATMDDDPLHVAITIDQLAALTTTASRYEALLMKMDLTDPRDRAALEKRLDVLVS